MNMAAQGSVVIRVKSFQLPLVVQAIRGMRHNPEVHPTHCSRAMWALNLTEEISIP